MELKNSSTYRRFLGLLTGLVVIGGILAMQAQAAQGDPPGEIPFVVVLDAGHGGHDPGNLGNGYLEKNIALNIVLEAGKALKKDPNVKVVFTRDDDTFVDLYKRGEIANKAKADLFVSVHCDSHSSDAHGAGTFVLGLHANKQNFEVAKKENSVIYLEDNYESRYADYDINSPESVIGLTIMQEEFLDQSILLGKLMQERFTGGLKRKDRKVKQAGFIVLHQTFMPSVLIETGFLTNKNEGNYLNSEKGQREMGGAIADAILEYRSSIPSNNTSITSNVPVEAPAGADTARETEAEVAAAEKAEVEVAAAEKAGNTEIAENTAAKQEPPGEQETVTDKKINDSALSAETLPPDPQNNASDLAEKSTPVVVASKDEPLKVVEEKKPSQPVEAQSDPDNQGSEAKEPAAREAGREAEADIYFKVQLMAVSKDMPLTPENFKGLNTLSKEPVNNMFRILYGNTASYEQAKILQAGARQKGYSQAYIVAYQDGKRIPVEKALQYLSN